MANINKTASSSAKEKIEGLDLLATAKAEIEAGNVEVLDASKALVRKFDLYLMPLMYLLLPISPPHNASLANEY